MHNLLPSQRGEVFAAIQEAGLDPVNFAWSTQHSNLANGTIPVLAYRDTRYFFNFDLKDGSHFCRYSPGDEMLVDEGYPGSWSMVLTYVRGWLACLGRELEVDDPWEALASGEPRSFQVAGGNSEFSEEERESVMGALSELEEYVRGELGAGAEERTVILRAVLEAKTSAEVLGRKDWVNAFLGSMVALAMEKCITSDTARDVAAMFVTLVRRIHFLLST